MRLARNIAVMDTKPSDLGAGSLLIVALLGTVLAIIGSVGAWISLPVSGSLPGPSDEMVVYGDIIRVFRQSFVALILLAAVAHVLYLHLFSALLSLVCLLILICFIHYGMFHDQSLLVSYMDQSEERIVLQRFISEYYWPNPNPDHIMTPIRKFEFLWQRLLLSWNIIGQGWKTAFIGTLLLFFVDMRRLKISPAVTVVFGLLFVFLVLLFTVPLIRAENLHREGDTLLASGQYSLALEVYQEAHQLDPNLGYSAPFLNKVSQAYYRLEGQDSVSGLLYQQTDSASDIAFRQLTPVFRKKLAGLYLMADEARRTEDGDDPLRAALRVQALKRDADMWALQGLQEYKNGELERSLSSFERAHNATQKNTHIKFIQAHIMYELGQDESALSLLDSALQSVWSKQLRADLLCTKGDVYAQMGEPLIARQAYSACYDLDQIYNYRAARSLGGT